MQESEITRLIKIIVDKSIENERAGMNPPDISQEVKELVKLAEDRIKHI